MVRPPNNEADAAGPVYYGRRTPEIRRKYHEDDTKTADSKSAQIQLSGCNAAKVLSASKRQPSGYDDCLEQERRGGDSNTSQFSDVPKRC
jgi:hypothetical protein